MISALVSKSNEKITHHTVRRRKQTKPTRVSFQWTFRCINTSKVVNKIWKEKKTQNKPRLYSETQCPQLYHNHHFQFSKPSFSSPRVTGIECRIVLSGRPCVSIGLRCHLEEGKIEIAIEMESGDSMSSCCITCNGLQRGPFQAQHPTLNVKQSVPSKAVHSSLCLMSQERNKRKLPLPPTHNERVLKKQWRQQPTFTFHTRLWCSFNSSKW